MKNQYFGDTRDLFKYDLALEIPLKSSISHFTFIPLLTPNESNNEGKRINYNKAKAGILRKDLVEFLQRCLKYNKRNIIEFEKFFTSFKKTHLTRKEINLTIYEKDKYFSNKERKEYFEKIPKNLLMNSIILLDPDIGLEVKSIKNKGEKYIKYEEIQYLFNQMDASSVLMIFQFIPRVKRDKYFSTIADRLKEIIPNSYIYYVSDNQIVFFILIKESSLQKSIEEILYRYSKVYGILFGKV